MHLGMSHASAYLRETAEIAYRLSAHEIDEMATELAALRERKGRLFLVGLGGSAANCSHACNDFRRLCGIESYSPLDNVAELTAAANDDGWNEIFKFVFAKPEDALFVLSVGGGAMNVSFPLCLAIDRAKAIGMKVMGIVGRDGGYTKRHGDCVVVVPTVAPDRVTPHTEAFQAVVWHCLVSHPLLQKAPTKW